MGLLVAVTALALPAGVLRFGLRQSDHHQTSVDGPIHGVAVIADTGSVEVLRAGPGAGATVRATRRFAWLAPRTTVRTVDGVLEVTATCPPFLALVCTVDYVMEVPPAATVEARADVGDVTVRVPDGAYDVDASAGVGDVRVGFRTAVASPHRITAGTGVGDVDVGAR